VLHRWRELSDMLGRRVEVDMLGRRHTGEVTEIDEDGSLILRDEGGRSIRIFSGDVKYL